MRGLSLFVAVVLAGLALQPSHAHGQSTGRLEVEPAGVSLVATAVLVVGHLAVVKQYSGTGLEPRLL